MKREKIKVRPTGLWLVFGPVLVCMWLAAVNYSNNLVYAILYLIASLCFVSTFHSWRNLASVKIDHIRIHSAFAGKDILVEIYLNATRPVYSLVFAQLSEERYTLSRRSLASKFYRWFLAPFGVELPRRPALMPLRGGGSLRIAAGDSCCAEAIFPAVRRGMYRFDTLLVRSSYPFGLFWASFSVPVGSIYFIYPEPKGAELWPELRPSGDNGSPYSTRPGDDFSGVRAYSPGESLRHIDWKAYARGRPLSVKQFTGGDGKELWLDAAEMARIPLEERLSQLAIWIVNAEKAEVPYALKLGRTTVPIGLGPEQCRRALETLAVAGLGPEER